ncbi:MAG: hypothetical protein DMD91_29755 [Candidatus Rokuibacteriota bacterium]|nr:MAG: hypothetical protein DMD91_29755 [Candidatus Rokubacteria bacterium]
MLSRYRETLRSWTDPVGRALLRLHLRPNHLTLMGLGVSLVAASAFVAGHVRTAGLLVLLAGLFDYFDGSLARAAGLVTPFGGFLDSVIDRYSDIVVLLGIVVLFASLGQRRGAFVAMAGLAGSVMVSYTKARAESIGVDCHVGFMERPERMICLIAGSVSDLLEPALWALAVLANLTAIHRIVFTWRATRETTVVRRLVIAVALLLPAVASADLSPSRETERAWARAVEAYQQGDPTPVAREFSTDTALESPIGDYLRYVLAEALARRGEWSRARTIAASIADHHRDSRLAPRALLFAAVLAERGGDVAESQTLLKRLIDAYPDTRELPEALYLLGLTGEAREQQDAAAHAYRELTILAPTSGWADGAGDRLAALARDGVRIPQLSIAQRLDRAERLLRGGVPKAAAEEAERVASETRDPSLMVRALRVVADAAQRLQQHDVAARTLKLAIARAPRDQRPALELARARALAKTTERDRALPVFATVVTTGSETEAAEAAWERARLLEDLERQKDATVAYRAVAQRYPAREVAGASLWRLGWLAYLDGDAHLAERHWSRIAEIQGGRTYRLASLYWAGRAREQTAGAAAAARFYGRVLSESPRSYYGALAAQRVAPAPEHTRRPGITLPADPAEAVGADPGYARVDLLRRIGLMEFAWEELEDVVQRSAGDPLRLYGLTSDYVKNERYHLALRILRRHFTVLATLGDPLLPQAFWEMLYPFGWRDSVTRAAEREGVDRFLVAALVREESSYYPRARSRAGARGLMQLMPGTAALVAAGLGIDVLGTDGLDEPALNIDLGTRFLADMLKEFGDPRLALAAYNAGPRRVRQWWRERRTNDVEAFVEQIPFDETRGYVKRVMFGWEEYRRIYGSAPAVGSP